MTLQGFKSQLATPWNALLSFPANQVHWQSTTFALLNQLHKWPILAIDNYTLVIQLLWQYLHDLDNALYKQELYWQ